MHWWCTCQGTRKQKMIQSKGELQGEPYVELESTPTISLYEALKNAQKCEEKDAFYAAVDVPSDSAIKGYTRGYT